jgi:pimeloyl-ACP methyl ester carboxylesterase
MRLVLFLAPLALVASATLAQVPQAVTADPPVPASHRAAMDVVHIPSHGELINGVLYRAAGEGPHPTMVLLHGLPGNEQNLDLAQAVRRDGWNVLTLHYRGSWGSPGDYSFTHVFEDAQSALDFVRDPAVAREHGIDTRHIVVAGHSLGGMAASIVGARNPDLAGVVMISAANFGAFGGDGSPHAEADLTKFMAGNMESLAGTSAAAMAHEAIAGAPRWNFVDYASDLARHPLLLVTSDDGLAGSSDALAAAVRKDGGTVAEVHLATDHSYSDQRIALESAVIRWLDSLPAR